MRTRTITLLSVAVAGVVFAGICTSWRTPSLLIR